MSNGNSPYTPGPWHASKPMFGRIDIYADHTVGGELCKSGKQSIAITHSCSKKDTPVYAEMFDANARLIAAAPDLLEALRAVVAVADRATDEFDLARAAIAKALGESA